MDKQKQIEEMANFFKRILPIKAMADWIPIKINHNYKGYAEELYNAGYRKIPENAVVLKREEYGNLVTRPNLHTAIDVFETRKETAEKFAERLKELEEALLDMVVQFCQMGEYGKLKHAFMSAEEQAFDVLNIKYGEKVDKVYKRFNEKWSRPIDEIAKEITEGKV